MIGTDVDTLMIAFLFSDVITCGLLTTLTRLSDAIALSIAKNLSVANVKAVRPAPGSPIIAVADPRALNPDGAWIGGVPVVDVVMDCWARLNLPDLSAQSRPSDVSSLS